MKEIELQSQDRLQKPRRTKETQTLNIRRELFKNHTLDKILHPLKVGMHTSSKMMCITSGPSLRKILKHVLYIEGKWLKTPCSKEATS